MASRMERYYKSDDSSKRRSQMNKKLYNSIYEESEYSNIEAIATMSKSNEIDITKIKELLKNREDYKKQKQYRQIINEKEEKKETVYTPLIEEIKAKDIKDILKSVEKKEDKGTYRRLDNTNYNILKDLKIHKEKEKGKEENPEELKGMIDTITNTSLLHKLDNRELGLDLLSDLKGDEDTIVETKDMVKALLEQTRKEEKTTSVEIDDSFYNTSMNFDKKDFMDFQDLNPKKFYQTGWFKISIAALIIIFLVIGIIVFIR